MFRKPDTGAVAPAVAAPEVVMPQENRAEVDRLVALMGAQDAAENREMAAFLQGMKFQQLLQAAAVAAGPCA